MHISFNSYIYSRVDQQEVISDRVVTQSHFYHFVFFKWDHTRENWEQFSHFLCLDACNCVILLALDELLFMAK